MNNYMNLFIYKLHDSVCDIVLLGPSNSSFRDIVPLRPGNSSSCDIVLLRPGNSSFRDTVPLRPVNSSFRDIVPLRPGNSGLPRGVLRRLLLGWGLWGDIRECGGHDNQCSRCPPMPDLLSGTSCYANSLRLLYKVIISKESFRLLIFVWFASLLVIWVIHVIHIKGQCHEIFLPWIQPT